MVARQIHAHLIESVIDQAERNECLINQLNEEGLNVFMYDYLAESVGRSVPFYCL